MAETKKFLDFPGLKLYDERIKELIKSGDSALEAELKDIIAQIATSSIERDAGLLQRISAVEANVGDMSLLGENVKTLAAAIIGESARAKAAEEALVAQVSWGRLGEK